MDVGILVAVAVEVKVGVELEIGVGVLIKGMLFGKQPDNKKIHTIKKDIALLILDII